MGIGRVNAYFLRLQYKFGVFWPIVMGCGAFVIVFCYGMFVYMYVEGWGVIDSFYMVLITISTVGYMEPKPLTELGRLLTSILILLGVGGFFYLAGSFTQLIIEGHLQILLGKRRIYKMIAALQDHFIVCGYGRIGSVVTSEIVQQKLPVVVIDSDPDIIAELEKSQILHIQGDATSDQHLIAAGIKKAKALITALSQEAENVYVTLTARQINPHMTIIARADKQASIQKLEFAGADRVLAPHIVGGKRMAQIVLRPTVTDFLELAMQTESLDLQMEEFLITNTSEVVNKNLIESEIRPRFNLIIIAIKSQDGKMLFNPQPQTVLKERDTVVVVGKQENLTQLQAIL